MFHRSGVFLVEVVSPATLLHFAIFNKQKDPQGERGSFFKDTFREGG